MENVNYNYNYYAQMACYPPQPTTDVKPPEPPSDSPVVSQTTTSASSETVVPNTSTITTANTIQTYPYGSAEYYAYYQNYYQYYNQYYQQYYAATQQASAINPMNASDSSKSTTSNADNIATISSTEGAVYKPVDQSYPQMFYPPPNYSVPPPSITPVQQNKPQFWNNTYQKNLNQESASKTTTNTPNISKPIIKTKNMTRPSRFQSQPVKPIADKSETEKPVVKPTIEKPPVPSEKPAKASTWPDALKVYVQRAFNSVNDKDKDKMQDLLKEKLEIIYSKDLVNKIDWGKEAIPLLPGAAPTSISPLQGNNSKKSYGLQKPKTYTPSAVSRHPPARSTSKNNRAGRTNSYSDRFSSRSRSSSGSSSSSDSRRRAHRRRKLRKRSRSNSSKSDRRSRSRSRKMSPLPRKKYMKSSSPVKEKTNSWVHEDRKLTSESFSYDAPTTPTVIHQSPQNHAPKKWDLPMVERLNITVNNNKRGKGKNRNVARKNQMKAELENNFATVSPHILAGRANRFKDHLVVESLAADKSVNGGVAGTDESAVAWEEVRIIGTCQDLEKRYLRLTRAPEPCEVRPLEVLHRSLEHVRQLWYDKRLEYRHICEQFKSIRQDLTVQCVRDDFTLQVYKTHATVALEAGDHEEFNQCQSQIKLLYEEGIACPDYLEFTSYRLIYYIFTRDFLNLGTTLSSLQEHHKNDPCVSFALRLRAAWSLNNYRKFFRLVNGIEEEGGVVPKLCGKVVSWFLDRERKAALRTMAKCYRPWIDLKYVSDTLGFSSTAECLTFLSTLIDSGASGQHSLSELFIDGDIDAQKLDMKQCAASI